MRNFNRLNLVVLLLSMLTVLGGCAASNTTSSSADAGTASSSKKGRKAKQEDTYSPAGVWRYEILIPNQDNYGIMKVDGEPGFFEVMLETDQFGELRVYDLEMTIYAMRGFVDLGGTVMEIEGDFDESEFSGAVHVGDSTYPIEATRSSGG